MRGASSEGTEKDKAVCMNLKRHRTVVLCNLCTKWRQGNKLWSMFSDIEKELSLVEEHISKSVRSRNSLLTEIVAEILSAGGKRLRPAFVIISAQLGKYNRRKVIPLAGAIEVLHTATLVHDDVVDRAGMRRGRVTVSKKYGVEMAIYTGDYLFTRAVMMMSREIPLKSLLIVSKGIKSICEGEVDQYCDRFNVESSVFSYLKRISRKTAVFFGAACAIGAQSAGCSRELIKTLSRFGFYYGMAFQIRDDINDFASNQKESGKPVGKDLLEGVITLPVIFVLRKNPDLKEKVKEYLKNRKAEQEVFAAEFAGLVREKEGLEEAEGVLASYVKRGEKVLEKLPAGSSREAFHSLLAKLGE